MNFMMLLIGNEQVKTFGLDVEWHDGEYMMTWWLFVEASESDGRSRAMSKQNSLTEILIVLSND